MHRPHPGRTRLAEARSSHRPDRAENPGWGYDRIVGALANLDYTVSDQTVGNVLRRHGIAPAPQRGRTMSWRDFLAAHLRVLAGADFFTVEVLKWRGLVTIKLNSRMRRNLKGFLQEADLKTRARVGEAILNAVRRKSMTYWSNSQR